MVEQVIELSKVSREYRTVDRSKGMLRSLFNRKYRTIRAVNEMDLSINRGELLGYIGPNGAGKSTTIKLMTGILVPSTGSVRVFGRDPYIHRQQNAKSVGVVFGQRSQLWWDLPIDDSFRLLKRMYEIPDPIYSHNMEHFRSILGLDGFIHQPVRQLSLGQKMRAELAAALLHDPKILFLDEPTIGLDVVVKEEIRHFVRRIRDERGTTVILTTHDMRDVEEICDRIVVIDKGSIVIDDNLATIRQKLGNIVTMTINFSGDVPAMNIPGAVEVKRQDESISYEFDRQQISPNKLLQLFASGHAEITDFTIKEPEIEDIVRRIFRGNIQA